MKSVVLMLTAAVMTATAVQAAAADAPADSGIYGKIDVARFPKPQAINAKPVTANLPVKGAKKVTPIYLHVPLGHERHWHTHCVTYAACDVPVYFVTEGWFVNVYLPVIGRDDGREQRYRLQLGRERDLRRDIHDSRADD